MLFLIPSRPFSQSYQAVLEDHRPAAEIIEDTLPFLLEHSKSCEHDAIKQRVQEFGDMFANVTEMEDEYVFKMEKSVPLWEKFNEHKEQLTHWLAGAEDAYQQRLQSGDADLTLRSLRNAEVCNNLPPLSLLSSLFRNSVKTSPDIMLTSHCWTISLNNLLFYAPPETNPF